MRLKCGSSLHAIIPPVKILGIETSCDETAAAIVENGRNILSNVVSSQVEIHARYGGVVPEVASRQHLLSILPVVREAMKSAGTAWEDIDGIAATIGPGLAGSLLVGANMAKGMALAKGLPIAGVNHLEAHIYANWLREKPREAAPHFPLLCLIVSGGHSDLVLMRGHGKYVLVGQTRDDAAGEAFDKAARILGLGYPGGPAIEKTAREGNSAAIPLPRARLKGSYDFSFSGLKTALWRMVETGRIGPISSTPGAFSIPDAAASFQDAVVQALVAKTVDAVHDYGINQVLLAGGVAANRRLREVMSNACPAPVRFPGPALCTDNAAMVAACGYYRLQAGKNAGWDLDVLPNLRLA